MTNALYGMTVVPKVRSEMISENTIYEADIPIGKFVLIERRGGWIIINIGAGNQVYMYLAQAREMAKAILKELKELEESEE